MGDSDMEGYNKEMFEVIKNEINGSLDKLMGDEIPIAVILHISLSFYLKVLFATAPSVQQAHAMLASCFKYSFDVEEDKTSEG